MRGSIPGLPNGTLTRDVQISGTLTGRLYFPPTTEARPLPVLVYLHGGGWVVGSVETHDPFCRLLSAASGVIVLAAEYRLAPESPFPAALDDSELAVRWVRAHAGEWNGDPSRLAVGGDSAGANLAVVAATRLIEQADPLHLQALLLLYPVTDHPSANHLSYTENASGYGLDAALMRFFWSQYAPQASPTDPDISPLQRLHIPALPPTFVATAEYDVLRGEGLAYAEKLRRSGVALTHIHTPEMNHNFPVHPGTVARFPQSLEVLGEMAQWLNKTLAQP